MASSVDCKFMNFLEQVDMSRNEFTQGTSQSMPKSILQAERNPKSTRCTTSRSVLTLSQADFTQTENEFKIKCISIHQLLNIEHLDISLPVCMYRSCMEFVVLVPIGQQSVPVI